jgi:pre-mRNA 3'-end-processing factor FIP1
MKPWRRPGADQSDYFNYGFDEFTWATYCMKQSQMAGVLNQQKEENKMFEQMMGGMAGGGMPGMPTGPAQQQQGGMPANPSEQEMQQMFMQAMAAQGINDPSQMDLGALMSQFAGGAGGMPGGMPQGVPTGPGGAPTGPGGGPWQGQQQGYQQQPGGRGGRGRRGQW